VDEGLNDLLGTAEPTEAPEPSAPEPAPEAAPPPFEPSTPEPPPLPDLSALQAELSQLKATRDEERRLQQQQWDFQQRELAFLRAAVPQPPPPPDPVQQVTQALQINEDDLAAILSGGPQAVATVTRGLQLAALLGAQLAEQRLVPAYQAEQARLQAQQQQESLANQQRTQFWAEHEDLRPHEDLVKLVVAQVAAEQGERERTHQQLLTWGEVRHQVAERTKALLGRFAPAAAAAGPGAPARVRPVVGEMGGGRGRGGGRTAFDDQFGDLLQ